MKLISAQVSNYRSVEDSEEFEIGQLTCLVGKNEAGKTTLLNALRGLRPLKPFGFDRVYDYPRRFSARFDERHPDGRALIVRTRWKCGAVELAAISDLLGEGVLLKDEFEITHGFGYKEPAWKMAIDIPAALKNIASRQGLSASERNFLQGVGSTGEASKALSAVATRTAKQDAMLAELTRLGTVTGVITNILEKACPKFFYTSHFERMSGEISVDKLIADQQAGKVSPGDQIFLDFLQYAGTSLEELKEVKRREELKARCEAAGNEITEEIFQFWSQNHALEVTIDFDTGKPADPPPFNAGTIVQIRIRNTNHKATLPLSERSAGFVWFFSFLAQFKQLKRTAGDAILLLDEPGLTLHGKAQGDLLRYITERLLPDHQVIFTTHSPFLVPADRLEDVRIVEDVLDLGSGRPVVKGTKVRSDVLRVDADTLFPLQGALGFDLSQTLFVGKNTLLVEGASDIVYIGVLSQALRQRKRVALDTRWVICPSGGIDKIAPFVRLFGGNHLNVAVLSDRAKGEQGKIDRLKAVDILKAGQFYTIADFLGLLEADVEDVLHIDLFCRLLNDAYSLPANKRATADALVAADPSTVRAVKQAEAFFRTMPAEVPEFDHFGPANWLLKHPELLEGDDAIVKTTLDRAEAIFSVYNKMLG